MAIDLEQLQARWREQDIHPLAFNLDEANFADLAVRELEPTLVPLMESVGFKQVGVSELPTILVHSPYDMKKIYEVKTIEELPEEIIEALKKQDKVGFDKIIRDWVSPSWDRYHRDLVPEDDRLYFLRGAKGNERYSAISLRHNSRMCSSYWNVMWTLQVDAIVGIDPEITRDMASSLVPGQDVRSQYGTERVRLIHRERYHDAEGYAPIYVDRNLIYSQHLIVTRDGEYPFEDSSKPSLIEEISGSLRNMVSYDESYRVSLLDLYKHAVALGIPLEKVFASKQA